jgi:phosphatidylserine synthase
MRSPARSVHVSNLLTYAALACGIGAIAAAIRGSAAGAGACLALAALADTFDGRFARLFPRTAMMEAVGAELDSLSDAVAFGVAPVAAVSILLAGQMEGAWAVWWLVSVLYTGCALTRLAHYNVSQTIEPYAGFVGLPAPVAALVWSTMLVFAPDVSRASVVGIALGAAMIAPLGIRRPGPTGLTVFAAWPLTLIVVHVAR